MIYRKSGIILPKNYGNVDSVITALTRYIPDFNGVPIKKTFYIELGDNVIIPRFYPIDDVVEARTGGEDIEIESNISPRNNRQKQCMDFMKNNKKGILCIEPGSGKTVIAIDTIAHYKKKTLIMIHKNSLINQWKEEFLRHTNIKEEDIGKLSSKNYLKVLNKKIIFTTPIVIANAVNNENMEFLDAIIKSNIGIFIVDECHVGIGPEEFSKSSLCVPAKVTFGLSATPTRSDGNNDILKYHLGDVFYVPPEEDELLKPVVFMIYFPFGVYSKYKRYINWGGSMIISRYYKQMEKTENYLKTVSKCVLDSFNKNRNSLILGNRIKPLLNIIKTVNVEPSFIGVFIPGTKDKKYEKIVNSITDDTNLEAAFKDKRLVFSTYAAARDGNNRPSLDCLIMTCPTSNVEQAAGRILRKMENKKTPIILDLVDTEGPRVNSLTNPNNEIGFFERMAEKREEIYNNKGWTVNKICLQ